MPDQVPDTLTGITVSLPGRHERVNRRARSNVSDPRASEPDLTQHAGARVFRVVPDNAALRAWGRKRGYRVAARGKIPDAVRAGFEKENGGWTVRIIRTMLPGSDEAREYYHVKQGPYTIKMTVDPFYVERVLGKDLYALLREVP